MTFRKPAGGSGGAPPFILFKQTTRNIREMTIVHHPLTFRTIRQDHVLVEKDGKAIGVLHQVYETGRWIYWQDGQPPTPSFRTLEEAQRTVGDMF